MVKRRGIVVFTLLVLLCQAKSVRAETSLTNIVDELFFQILSDPSNLQLNFNLFQEQIRIGDLAGAETTLERVVILDPFSVLAKILLAETRIKSGKLFSARAVLSELLSRDDISKDTIKKAQILLESINAALTPYSYSHLIAYGFGTTDNGLGAPTSDQILFLDFPIDSTTEKRPAIFHDVVVNSTFSYDLPYQVPATLSITGLLFSRMYPIEGFNDSKTYNLSINYQRKGPVNFQTSFNSALTEVNNQKYNLQSTLTLNADIPVSNKALVGINLGVSKADFYNSTLITTNSQRSNNAFKLGLSLTYLFNRAVWTNKLFSQFSDAPNKTFSYQNSEWQQSLQYRITPKCNISASTSFQKRQNEQPDLFVSAMIKKTKQIKGSIGFNCILNSTPSANFSILNPYVMLTHTNTDSNILNFKKSNTELTMGIRVRI